SKPSGFFVGHVSVHCAMHENGWWKLRSHIANRTIAIEPAVVLARIVSGNLLQPFTLLPAIQVEGGPVDTNGWILPRRGAERGVRFLARHQLHLSVVLARFRFPWSSDVPEAPERRQ